MNPYSNLLIYFTSQLEEFKKDLNKQPAELYQPMQYIFGLGGKHVRPLLTLVGNDLFNGKSEDAINSALAIECFHNFSLMHDDIMDVAPLRRGKQTVHQKWNHNIALLSGDGLLVVAYQTLCKSDGNHVRQLLNVFNKTGLEVCEGQQLDMNFEKRMDVKIEEYLRMISLKTGALLGCSLQMGAITANAKPVDQQHLYEFGKHIGIAFQLKDDLLDVYGEQHKVGKQIAGDIISNKKTYLLIKALESSTHEQKKTMEHWLMAKEFDTLEKIKVIKTIYEELSMHEKTNAEMNKHYQKALGHLKMVRADENKKYTLQQFADTLMNREN